MERRLVAILSGDVVGYSALMAADEAATIRDLAERRGAISDLVDEHGGEVVDATGDAFLATFPTALAAAECAAAIQRDLGERNANRPPERAMCVRIGVHLGDVVVEDGRVYGDGVNVAARLEALAEPGGICVSAAVHEQVRSKLEHGFEDLGEQRLKNIPHPVRVHRVELTRDVLASPGAEAAGFGGRPAIAVLPFDNLSRDAEQEYFADGLAEDLITRLSGWRMFPVISRNSTFVYKGEPVDVKRLGRELGARFVVEGSVRRAGDRLRVTAQLIDADTGHHVWAERYDRELRDLFDLQDEITEAIVASMHPELQRFEQTRAGTRRPSSLDAWECYQRGYWHFWHLSAEQNARARTLFERSAELDAGFAPAWAALARTHQYDVIHQWTDSLAHSVGESLRAAERGLALDPTDPGNQISAAMSYAMRGEREKALSGVELAVKLNPSSADGYVNLAFHLTSAGRGEEAVASIERALRLSPRDPDLFMYLSVAGMAYFAAGCDEEAVDATRRSLQLRPDWPFAACVLAAALGQLGRLEEARIALGELLEVAPDFSLDAFAVPLPHPDLLSRLREGLYAAGFEAKGAPTG